MQFVSAGLAVLFVECFVLTYDTVEYSSLVPMIGNYEFINSVFSFCDIPAE